MKHIKFSLFFLITIFIIFITSLFSGMGHTKSLEYIKTYVAEDVYPDGDNYREIEGKIPVTAVYKNKQLVGYVYITTDIVPSIGYSGKSIKTLVGISLEGNIIGAKVIEHHEPILLAGISMQTFDDFVSQHVGLNVYKEKVKLSKGYTSDVDLISGATVTAMIVNDSVMRSGRKMLSLLNGGEITTKQQNRAKLKEDVYQQKSWADLIEEGAISRLTLSHDKVNQAFVSMGGPADDIYGEYICKIWTKEPESFNINPFHHNMGLNI